GDGDRHAAGRTEVVVQALHDGPVGQLHVDGAGVGGDLHAAYTAVLLVQLVVARVAIHEVEPDQVRRPGEVEGEHDARAGAHPAAVAVPRRLQVAVQHVLDLVGTAELLVRR